MAPNSGNLDEYLDPILYDMENPDFKPEGLFYLDLAREAGGPILELGCGTGRMTIPLAEHCMEALLEHAGFQIIERYGGPDRSLLSNASPLQV